MVESSTSGSDLAAQVVQKLETLPPSSGCYLFKDAS